MANASFGVFFILTFLLSGVVSAQEAQEQGYEELTFDREGERCLSTRSIRDTDILSDRMILFEMPGNKHYLNNLSYECRGLRRAGSFSYQTRAGRLCNVDTIRVIEQFGGSIREGIGCGLGLFYPITEDEAEFLRAEADGQPGRLRPRIGVENPNALEEDEDEDAD